MQQRRKFIWIFIFLFLAIVFIIQMVNVPDFKDVKGGFKKVAFVRNENNLNAVKLFYAFSVSDTLIADYYALGDMLPHNTNNGVTTVFFFNANGPYPDTLSVTEPHFNLSAYKPIAVYIREKELPANVYQ